MTEQIFYCYYCDDYLNTEEEIRDSVCAACEKKRHEKEYGLNLTSDNRSLDVNKVLEEFWKNYDRNDPWKNYVGLPENHPDPDVAKRFARRSEIAKKFEPYCNDLIKIAQHAQGGEEFLDWHQSSCLKPKVELDPNQSQTPWLDRFEEKQDG